MKAVFEKKCIFVVNLNILKILFTLKYERALRNIIDLLNI